MEDKLEIKNVMIEKLKYAPYNPRRISDEVLNKLKRSIQEFGYIEPIVVNKRTMHVIGGNQRLKVLRQLDIKEVQAVIVDLDDTHEKALNIALNKINGEWDLGKLKDIFLEFENNEVDMDLTGFNLDEIENIVEHSMLDIEKIDIEPFFEEKVVFSLEREKAYLTEEEYQKFKNYLLGHGETIEEGIREIIKDVSG